MPTALCDLEYVKDCLQVSGSSEDSRLGQLILAASAGVERYCQRTFLSADYVELYSGNNTPRIALRKRPVTAVSEVRLDSHGYFGLAPGSFDSTTVLTEGSDWTLLIDEGTATSNAGVLLRVGTVWPMVARSNLPTRINTEVGPAYGNVKVTYTAGFIAVPEDVKYAVALVVQQMRQSLKHGGNLASEHIGDYSYKLFDGLIKGRELADVRYVLGAYREVPW